MGEKLDINQIKKMAHEIIGEEARKNNINVNVFPLTFVEYYKGFEERKGRKFKLYDAFHYVSARGYYEPYRDNIYICLENPSNIFLLNNYFDLVKVCYYEFRHRMQDDFDEYSYESFLRDIEHYTMNIDVFDYKLTHDKYSFEIGANLYGVSKAKEYLIKNYPYSYEKQKDYINMLEKRYKVDYLTYDAVDTVERFIKASNLANEKVQKIKQRGLSKNTREVKVSPVLDIFLDDNNNFRKVSEIIKNERFKQLDQRIISAFFSCNSFLSSLDMESLAFDELEVVSSALEYTNSVYQNQMKIIENNVKDIGLLEYLKSQRTLIGKIGEIGNYIFRLFKKKLSNVYRKDDIRQVNMRNIPYHLNKSKRLIREKSSKGFIMYDIFYIVGLLFSILTIIYIMIR